MSIVLDTLSDIVLGVIDMIFARKTDRRGRGKEGRRGIKR